MMPNLPSVILGLVSRIHSGRRAIDKVLRGRRMGLPIFVRADLQIDPRDKPEGDGCVGMMGAFA